MHQDSLGSTSVVTNTSGAQYGYTRYYPYGSTRDSSGSLDTDKKFTGQRLDGTGLYYYGARYYDPSIGRFISADPISIPAGAVAALSRYSYSYNNPLKYIDPSGLDVVFVNGFGSTDPDNPENWEESEWAEIIRQLGLIESGEKFIFFNWEGEGSRGGSQLTTSARAAEMLSNQIAAAGLTDIKLIGFSKGGAVIMEYLAQIAEGTRACNPEITKAITVNSPIGGGLMSSGVGFERYTQKYSMGFMPYPYIGRGDRLANLSSRLASKSPAMDVQLTTVVDTNNYVTHDRIPGVQAITLSTSNWFWGHLGFIAGQLDVHDNIIDNPGGWINQVAWR